MNSDVLHDRASVLLKSNRRDDILLSGSAAREACLKALESGLSVGRVEGGQWLNPGFMSRMDTIWEAPRHAISIDEVRNWNLSAARFIEQQMRESPDPKMPPADAFVLVVRKFGLR